MRHLKAEMVLHMLMEYHAEMFWVKPKRRLFASGIVVVEMSFLGLIEDRGRRKSSMMKLRIAR